MPSASQEVDTDVITEDERVCNTEFFSNSTIKTPERYMRIRNTMLALWRKQRPQYLTKTAARKQIRDAGDVNVIGRVHEFLEAWGAINFGSAPGGLVLPRLPPAMPRVRASPAGAPGTSALAAGSAAATVGAPGSSSSGGLAR